MWHSGLTSTLSSLKWVCCANVSLVFTSGYWFCRNSSSSASSCSSVKMVRWRLVRLCAWPGDGSSRWASPSLHVFESIAGGHPYGQAPGRKSDLTLGRKTSDTDDKTISKACQQSWRFGLTFMNEVISEYVPTVGAVATAQARVRNTLCLVSNRTHCPLF